MCIYIYNISTKFKSLPSTKIANFKAKHVSFNSQIPKLAKHRSTEAAPVPFISTNILTILISKEQSIPTSSLIITHLGCEELKPPSIAKLTELHSQLKIKIYFLKYHLHSFLIKHVQGTSSILPIDIEYPQHYGYGVELRFPSCQPRKQGIHYDNQSLIQLRRQTHPINKRTRSLECKPIVFLSRKTIIYVQV